MKDITVKSQGGLIPHTHSLVIPAAVMQSPPESGVTLETSVGYSLVYKHKHSVHLTQSDLTQIRDGKNVVVRDTDKGRHTFTVG